MSQGIAQSPELPASENGLNPNSHLEQPLRFQTCASREGRIRISRFRLPRALSKSEMSEDLLTWRAVEIYVICPLECRIDGAKNMLTPANATLQCRSQNPTDPYLARQFPLRLHVRRVRTPMLFVSSRAILSNAVGLVWLIEGLEVEHIDAPVKHTADTALPVGDGVVGARGSGTVAGAAVGGPPRLTVPKLGCFGRAGDRLDVIKGLHHVVEVRGSRVGNLLGLPVGEGVDKPGRVSVGLRGG